jgi:hypothetical protein
MIGSKPMKMNHCDCSDKNLEHNDNDCAFLRNTIKDRHWNIISNTSPIDVYCLHLEILLLTATTSAVTYITCVVDVTAYVRL